MWYTGSVQIFLDMSGRYRKDNYYYYYYTFDFLRNKSKMSMCKFEVRRDSLFLDCSVQVVLFLAGLINICSAKGCSTKVGQSICQHYLVD